MRRLLQLAGVALLILLAIPTTRAQLVEGFQTTVERMQAGSQSSVKQMVGLR